MEAEGGLRVACFFHVYSDGRWHEPLAEFREALGDFDGPAHIGVVGVMPNYIRVCQTWPEATPVASARVGFESITINALWEYAQHNDGAVLYGHTKGASYSTDGFRDRWRRSMLNRVVKPWRANLALLDPDTFSECGSDGSVDAVGAHWLTEAAFPGMMDAMTEPAPGSGFFGGNFWIARCDYLRKLPPCPAAPRWQAESWVGWGHPRVVDLLPGWPSDMCWPELCS